MLSPIALCYLIAAERGGEVAEKEEEKQPP